MDRARRDRAPLHRASRTLRDERRRIRRVIDAVRVPPSACSTSQSRVIVRSPSALRSMTARSERPMRRWISCVRPLCLPFAASARGTRVRGAGKHAVLGRHPALAPLPRQERRHRVFDACRAQHVRIPELDEHGAFSMFREAPRECCTGRN